MLEILMAATEAFGTWGPGPVPKPPGLWDGLLDDLKITDILIVFFTPCLVVANIGLWLSTRSTTRKGQRAYLSVEPQGIVTLNGSETLAHIGIRNTGHLPARDVFWTCHIEAPHGGDRREFPITGQPSGSYIVPIGTPLTFGTVRIPANSIDMPAGQNQYCYVWGRVRYNDGFDETSHTLFCHRYPINIRTPGGEIDSEHARYHDYGNEAN